MEILENISFKNVDFPLLKDVLEVQEKDDRLYENSNTFEIANLSSIGIYSISCAVHSIFHRGAQLSSTVNLVFSGLQSSEIF